MKFHYFSAIRCEKIHYEFVIVIFALGYMSKIQAYDIKAQKKCQ